MPPSSSSSTSATPTSSCPSQRPNSPGAAWPDTGPVRAAWIAPGETNIVFRSTFRMAVCRGHRARCLGLRELERRHKEIFLKARASTGAGDGAGTNDDVFGTAGQSLGLGSGGRARTGLGRWEEVVFLRLEEKIGVGRSKLEKQAIAVAIVQMSPMQYGSGVVKDSESVVHDRVNLVQDLVRPVSTNPSTRSTEVWDVAYCNGSNRR
ncbi:hypothetical protein EDB86DRAFT_3137788 [Lactarius hatsudake]|nr:hypothetical protein EDB86DRAFT_3137788 [Lactarius hatsudake]